MHRSELEHLIRAAASIVNECEMMIVGSQSKAVANRAKDWEFIGALFCHGICAEPVVQERVGLLPIDAQRISKIKQRLARAAADAKAAGTP